MSDAALALAVEYLADEVAALEAELVSYRQMTQVSLEQSRELNRRLAAQSVRNQELRDELRRYIRSQVAPCD
jgi:hypothetical protein